MRADTQEIEEDQDSIAHVWQMTGFGTVAWRNTMVKQGIDRKS